VRVAVAGSSGFVGSALLPRLTDAGHSVVRLVRGTPQGPDEVAWDPSAGTVDVDGLRGVDAIVNLAGAGIGDRRWSASYKRVLYDSHVGSAAVLARAAAELAPAPSALVSVGAMGYYGRANDGGRLTESSPAGADFTATIVVDKEAATSVAAEAGVRVTLPRLGLVMDASGSTFGRRLLPFAKAGILGPLGDGRAVWSVVSLSDVTRAITFLLSDESTEGPYNVAAPESTTNREFTRLLGQAVHRPTIVPVPKVGLQLLYGEFAEDILASFDVDPARIVESGFTFEHPDAPSVVKAALHG
jgi:uncharacterized protein (TIGR01777 family)